MLDLTRAQELLLEIAEHCMHNADYVDFEYRSYYYNVLTCFFTRGEFSMEHLRPRKVQTSRMA